MTEAKSTYAFTFFRAGGVDQVVLATGADIEHLAELDQKLWLALSCPTRGLEFDSRTLDLIDTDRDGHIRPAEVLAAVAFVRDAFRNLDALFEASGKVPLSLVRDDTAVGKCLLTETKNILEICGRADGDAISLDDIADTAKILAATRFNGDGILPAESAGSEPVAKVLRDIMDAVGSKTDRSGRPGVDRAAVDRFFDEAGRYVAWLDRGEQQALTSLVGAETAAAADALFAVATKIDDYFARTRLASFDGRAAAALNPGEAELALLRVATLSEHAEEIAKLPLASVAADRALPLVDGLNPAWAERIAVFATKVVVPVLGAAKSALTEKDWGAIKGRLAPYLAWQADKPATPVAKLGPARLRELLAGTFRRDVIALIDQDASGGDLDQRIEKVEKMIRLHRDLVGLLRNFVNFSEFYGRRKAIFQAGTLFVDGRSCDLCLPVDDTGKHAGLAGLARAYLLYCDCTRKSGEKRSIVAAVTSGETDNLMAGRNGVFVDRKGNDWDATITRIVENPIGIGQAFWSPYKSFVRLVEEQLAKRISTADEEARQKVKAAAADAAAADKAKAGPPEKPAPKKIDVGTVAALGVAVGGIATFFSSILAMFFGLGIWMPVGLLTLILAISGPSMMLAWLKLRHRNIGPILDANGWSVNALAKINVPFGAALTQVAALPRGSKRQLHDPFAEKKHPWGLYLFLLVVLVVAALWCLGRLDCYLPEHIRSSAVLGWPTGEDKPVAPAPSVEGARRVAPAVAK